MTKSVKLDWIAATAELAHQDIYFDTLEASEWTPQRGMLGYRHVFKEPRGSFFCTGMPKNEGHFHAIFGGQSIRAYETLLGSITPLLDLLHACNARASRCDVAFDFIDEGWISPVQFVRQFGLTQTDGYIKKCVFMENTEGGNTLYFGSGASNTQICIYDKAAEQGTPLLDWIRVEVRLRGKKAWQVFDHYANGGYDSIVDFALQSAIEGAPVLGSTFLRGVSYSGVGKPNPDITYAPDIDKWLASQVAPALARAIGEGDEDVLYRLEKMIATRLGR